MNLNFLNPFSDKFLQRGPEHSIVRKTETARNSVGYGEDQIDWGALVNGYTDGYVDPGEPYEQSNVIFDTVFTNKYQKIMWYRNMALYPLVQKALTVMTDEAVCFNADGKVAKFELNENHKANFTDYEFNSLKTEFNYIVDCVIGKEQLWDYYKKWLTDAELYWEICLSDKGDKVVGINTLPPYCMINIYDKDSDLIRGYIEDINYLKQSGDSNPDVQRFLPEQIAYVNYGRTWANRNDVRGHLESAIRPLNQLRNIEDALTVYRITRATEKRLFNIYCGRMPPEKAAAFVQEVTNKYRKNLNIDPNTGMIISNKNVAAMTEDFFFPKDDSGNGTTIDTYTGGATFNGQIEDLYMFQKMVMDALQIPQDRWKADEISGKQYVQGVDGLPSEEAAFQKLNRRLRKRFADIILQVFLVHLKVRNYPEKFLDKAIYDIDLCPATDFDRMRDLALAEKRGATIGTLSQFLPTPANIKPDAEELGPLFSRQFFMEKMLGLSTEEMLLNKAMLDREIEEMQKKADAAKEEGGDEEGDGGDDLGF